MKQKAQKGSEARTQENHKQTTMNPTTDPSKHFLWIYSGPLSARQGSWRADNSPL